MTFAAFSLQAALGPFAVGVAVLLLVAALLVWSARIRDSYTAPDTVIFARSPAKLIGGAVVVAVCAFAVAIVGIDPNNGAFLTLTIVGIFALIWCGQFLGPALIFYVADQQGLTRQILSFRKTLPWNTIDWIYPQRRTTSYRAYGVVKVGQSTQHNVIIEAGPRRSIKIVVNAWLVGGDSTVLLETIQQRAAGAQYGFDKQPLVFQLRNAAQRHGVNA